MRKLLCAILMVASILAGCKRSTPAAPADPAAFLKWSMDRYAAAHDFQASEEVMSGAGVKRTSEQARMVRFQSPNKFRVESKDAKGEIIDAISDGINEADYDNRRLPTSSIVIPSPSSFESATSADLSDPGLCGSLIYPFFGGSKDYSKLVAGPVTMIGRAKTPEGETLRILKFNTPGAFKDVKTAIGERTGYVYLIGYRYAPGKLASTAKTIGPNFTEAFENIKVDEALSRGSFDPNIPGAVALASMPGQYKGPKTTPIPLGDPAPQVKFETLDGKTIDLASLRGHPVMLDFWATWCAPCRQALPDTAHIALEGEKSGLKVLAVSDESASKIENFISSQAYRLPAFRDQDDSAQKAFLVPGLPSQIFIDPKGVVVDYLVGFHPIADVRAALQKTGYQRPTLSSSNG
jgi:thiol-disulfide isomerase/thioredoxin